MMLILSYQKYVGISYKATWLYISEGRVRVLSTSQSIAHSSYSIDVHISSTH